MITILLKAAGIWVLFVIVAIVSGVIRESFLTPVIGDQAAHQIGSIAVSLFVFLITLGLIKTLGISNPSRYWIVGGIWVLMTIAFEFLFGHYVMGHPWNRLFADYNILKGRLWVLVLVSAAVSPYLTAKLRGIT